MTEILQLALEAALAGAQAILEEKRKNIHVEWKSDNSPVTNADFAASKAIEKVLDQSGIPILGEESTIVPWEVRKKWKQCWIVDPLDGTRDFAKGGNEYAVNIAWVEQGAAQAGIIAIPEQGIVYFGEKDQVWKGKFANGKMASQEVLPNTKNPKTRTYVISKSNPTKAMEEYIRVQQKEHLNIELKAVGSALKFCELLEGRAQVYPRFSPCMEWDIASGHALLRAQGKGLKLASSHKEMHYNKEDLFVPHFIAQ